MNEIELVRHIADGKSSKMIASLMGYAEITIETYRFRMYKKYRAGNAPHLVSIFYEMGKLIPKNMEMWRDVNGYEGLYEVSNLGNVKSVTRSTNNQYCREDIILSPADDGYGYNQVVLCKRVNGIRVKKTFKVHRLVADAFIENPHNKPIVNHKDWNTKNNTVDNLNWMTSKENLNHRDPSKLKNRNGNETEGNKNHEDGQTGFLREYLICDRISGRTEGVLYVERPQPEQVCSRTGDGVHRRGEGRKEREEVQQDYTPPNTEALQWRRTSCT